MEKGNHFEKEIREALHTSRLEEQLKGPTKAGVMTVRVKTEAQFQMILCDLRTTSRGEELLVLQRGQHLPPWPTTKLLLSYPLFFFAIRAPSDIITMDVLHLQIAALHLGGSFRPVASCP